MTTQITFWDDGWVKVIVPDDEFRYVCDAIDCERYINKMFS